jgi:hypothetical protein
MKLTKKILIGGVLLSSSLFLSVPISAAGPLKLDANGHIFYPGSPPTPEASCSDVAVEGTDNAGFFQVPAQNVTRTSCFFTFSQPYSFKPACVVSWGGEFVDTLTINTDTTGFLISVRNPTVASLNGSVINYQCVAVQP